MCAEVGEGLGGNVCVDVVDELAPMVIEGVGVGVGEGLESNNLSVVVDEVDGETVGDTV